LARRQHGLVTRAQLLQAGVRPDAIWRRLRSGVLEEALPGVYRLPGAPRTWLQSLMGACLWAGDDAVASHRAAAALWGFDGFGEGPLEITAGKKNQSSARFKVHQPPVPPSLVTRKQWIPVTNAARTLLDLASCVSEERMNQVVDEALRKGLVSMESLRRFVDREKKSGRRGVGVLRRLVEQREPGYQPSASELQASVRRLLVAAGLEVVEEYVITDAGGNFIARVDFRLLGEWVVVEVEGRANHSSKLDWQHDLDRRNALTAEGWAVIHATADRVKDRPEEFLAEVDRARASQARLQRGRAGSSA